MNIGKARALFEQVASGEYHGSTVGEYLEAVKIVLNMETHNSISKKMIISVCKWLVKIAEKAVSPYRWIPVSERLPEEYGNYLISIHGEDEPDIGTINPNDKRGWSLCDANGFYWAGDKKLIVTAWMPLPSPYQKGATT